MTKSRKQTKPRPKAAQKSAISPVMIGAVVAAAILLVAGLIVLGNRPSSAGEPLDLSPFPTLGQADAPVTMVEFSDYGCQYCRDFALSKFELVVADYIETGKVKYVVYHYNLGRPEMALATEAAWCAQDQGKFSEYRHALFENQGRLAYDQASLVDLAARTGLDQTALAQCLANRTHRADVESARQAAVNQGVTATPTFFINNQRVQGNQPYNIFQRTIDQELALAQ